eukprot:6627782-Alexandrium_andersonii.AAC.1
MGRANPLSARPRGASRGGRRAGQCPPQWPSSAHEGPVTQPPCPGGPQAPSSPSHSPKTTPGGSTS